MARAPSRPARTPAPARARGIGTIAVSVREASHQYSSIGKDPVTVLNNFNMTVHRSNIYALLGASGCGKTTVLRSVVGQLQLDAGAVRVQGRPPHSGPDLGYMPQELAVHTDFTIAETLRFFGWLSGMTSGSIRARSAELSSMLELPEPQRRVCDLSGGQQRRLSFAVALLHSPPLLILDEPTVGVDPVLRQSIWEYLLELARSGKATVIITTHYIEEARQAHVVGLMRRGSLLAEAPPAHLILKFSCSTLEEVLLKLCFVQEQGVELQVPSDTNNDSMDLEVPELPAVASSSLWRLKALTWKNLMWIWRSPSGALYLSLLPAFIMFIFCAGVGHTPDYIPVATVNLESDCASWPQDYDCRAPANMSCLVIDRMRAHSMHLLHFGDEETATLAVQNGRARAMVRFASNFTDSLVHRMAMVATPLKPQHSEDGTLESSTITVNLDMSFQTVGYILWRDLYNLTTEALDLMNRKCTSNPHMIRTPIQFNDPIYGSYNALVTDYILPGIILSSSFVFGFTASMSSLLPEKADRILERTLVCGARMVEVVAAHFCVQVALVTVQVCAVLLVAFVGFRHVLLGSSVAYVSLCLCQGVCGMWFGFLTAVLFESTTAGTYIGAGSYLTLMFLSGMLWPVEGMHTLVRWVAPLLPMTTATSALRYIALRAWTINQPGVYIGFLTTLAWTMLFMTLTLTSIRLKFKYS